ncbi:MAG: phosphoribosyl-ATP diphosphatase [Chloroflexota bacterium]|nr:phosphoribosyl-ATP diphosphatase [Chloroflexota bacterium]
MTPMLQHLESLIKARQEQPQDGSYTNSLLDAGTPSMAQKVGEEAVEVVIAALSQTKIEQIEEIADLFYHLLVLMRDREIALDDIENELVRRHGAAGGSTSGTSALAG